ncbi:tetratricopeptide repeat protein, partial [Fulvivirga sp. RKSG066]|uniref:tetratricopeptide repeat protein n=1 Tax=Fulvivirga aurantia TaxID=2529383 RepID=UPI0012BD34C1
IYKKLNDLDKSLDYHKKALAIRAKVLGADQPLMSYINLAEIYLAWDSLDIAETYYSRIIEFSDTTDNRKMAYALIGLGEIEGKRNNYEKAEELHLQGLEIYQNIKDNRGQASATIKLGKLYSKQGLHDSAEIYFEKGSSIAESINAKDLVLESLMAKVLADSAREDYQSAFINYWNYVSLKDSIFNEEKSSKIARMQTAYETELLQKENEANQIKVKQQATAVIGVVMALILCIAVAGAFYKQRRVQQIANKLLAAKNKEIFERNNEIEQQSKKLAQLNRNLENLNEELEKKVRIRTNMLRHQNEVLSQYAFTNAHELRAPVANILGLTHLLENTELGAREREVVDHLRKATDQLDQTIRDIRERLETSEELVS